MGGASAADTAPRGSRLHPGAAWEGPLTTSVSQGHRMKDGPAYGGGREVARVPYRTNELCVCPQYGEHGPRPGRWSVDSVRALPAVPAQGPHKRPCWHFSYSGSFGEDPKPCQLQNHHHWDPRTARPRPTASDPRSPARRVGPHVWSKLPNGAGRPPSDSLTRSSAPGLKEVASEGGRPWSLGGPRAPSLCDAPRSLSTTQRWPSSPTGVSAPSSGDTGGESKVAQRIAEGIGKARGSEQWPSLCRGGPSFPSQSRF